MEHFNGNADRSLAKPILILLLLVITAAGVNLLSNAVKFTPVGGAVSLDVAVDPEAEAIRFAVQDTGIGIAHGDMDRLFLPFKQLDSSLSRQYEGTGLGLGLVRQLAKLHGGSIAVESQVDQGSRFTLALPYRPPVPADLDKVQHVPAAGAEQEAARRATQPSSGARVLLVEDNEVNIKALVGYLKALSYQVVIARNGLEAIGQADTVCPDIILMDIQMPEMDGLEATRRLRAMPTHATPPIIALTALAMPGDRERCIAAGASDYLTKPVSLRGLVEVIEGLLR
jgi:CheY-like chemotaxis protein